jgi:outer membrane cobalamin receptor
MKNATRYALRIFGAVLFVISIIGFAFPQPNPPAQNSSDHQRISGVIVDPSGAPLPRTLVEIRDMQGKLVAVTQTNSRGEYSLELARGKYSLTATLAGFAPLKDKALEIPGAESPVQLTLQVSSPQEQVVVTATQTETPLAQVGSSVSVISGDELSAKGITSVSDALRELAGLTVVQTGGMGGITSLFMRGGDSDYTKVLIDGVPVNDPGGSYNFSNLSTSNIDRIEIVRGPQSALFGSDAMSGVVQIFTKKGTSEGLSPKPSVILEGGNYSTFRYGGSLQGSNDRMDYIVSFSRLDTDNNVPNDSFNDETITGNLGIHLSHKTELRAIFRSEAGRSGVPGPTAFERPDLDAYYRVRNESGSLTLTDFRTAAWTQKLSYTVNDSRQFSDDPINSGSYTPSYDGIVAPFAYSDYVYQYLNQTRRQEINYQSDLILPHGHLFTAGGDYERESGISGDPTLNPASTVRNNYGAYFQDQWSASNRFFATGGVRLDHNESFGFFASPRVSLAFLAHQADAGSFWGITKIKANFGMGIKEPTLAESYSTSIYYMGNPNLRPEQSVSFDTGIEQVFNAGKGALELTYFQNRFRDQIGFAITDYTTFAGSYFNIGKSRARGLESTLRYDIISKVQFSGSYTFVDSEVLESSNTSGDPAFNVGQWLFRRPRHSGHVALLWKPGRVSLGASALMVGRRVDSDYSGLGLTTDRAYATLNLLAGLRLVSHMSLFATVNNLLDKQYMEVLGYPALGRNFRIGLRAGF